MSNPSPTKNDAAARSAVAAPHGATNESPFWCSGHTRCKEQCGMCAEIGPKRTASETPLNAAAPRSAVGARCIKCGVPEGAICGYVSRGAAECPQKISSHTPGPWRVAPPSIGRFKVVSVDGLKVVGEASNYNEQAEANARLIAAAPDLLAFAEFVVGMFQTAHLRGLHLDMDKQHLMAQARAAIKKARGE